MPQDTINDPTAQRWVKKCCWHPEPLLRQEGSLGTQEAGQSPVTEEFAALGAEQSYRVSDLLVLSTSGQQGCSCHHPCASENLELGLPRMP